MREERKVDTLLDAISKDKLNSEFNSGAKIIEHAIKWKSVEKILELYNMKTTADSIIELFENWDSVAGIEVHNDKTIVVLSSDELGEYFVIDSEFEQKHRTMKINSFIYACKDLYIDLYWNEPVYNKYFKNQ